MSPDPNAVGVEARPASGPAHGERPGRRLWVSLLAVVLVAAALESYGIATWPMADDEVPSLVELGILHIGAEHYFSVPPDQIGKLPKVTPVWNAFQRTAIGLLPAGELSYRLPSLVCAVLTSAFVFFVAARWRGLWFAAALAIVMHGSQMFLHVSQIDRFYALPFLLLAFLITVFWLPADGWWPIAVVPAVTMLTVLSHNVTVPAFGLAAVAAVALWMLGQAPRSLVWRTLAAAVPSALTYLFYLRPLVRGWNSTGNPTPVLVSFAAHAGIPALALAGFGAWLALTRREHAAPMRWWLLMFAGSLATFQITAAWMSWNPRYFLFFLPAVWILAAHAMAFVAERLGHRATGVVWYAAVALLLVPGVLSHFADGSRHDYRQAAAVLASSARSGDIILSDDAETLTYYLPADLRPGLEVRTRVRTPPAVPFFLVTRANAWMPTPRFPGRRVEVLAEISHRRFDQFSHILRVFRVEPSY